MSDKVNTGKKPGKSVWNLMTGKLHLWLGLASGLIVVFLGITGCILAFEQEIRNITQPYLFVEKQDAPFLPPSRLKAEAEKNAGW